MDLGFARDDGGRPGSFLDFSASARSVGMGRAHTAVADDASAGYWNPAGLSQVERKDLVTLYSLLEEDTGFGMISYAQPAGAWGTFGLNVVNLRSDNFVKRDSLGVRLGEFSQTETAFMISHGFSYGSRWRLGSTVKAIRQDIDSQDDMGFGLDLGALCRLGASWQLGLAARNLWAPEIKLRRETDTYPRDLRLGIQVTPFKNWMIATDLGKAEHQSVKLNLGTEVTVRQMLALRTGINESEITAGFGFKLGDWTLDYAFGYNDAVAGVDDLGGSHRLGFRVSFGNPDQKDPMAGTKHSDRLVRGKREGRGVTTSRGNSGRSPVVQEAIQFESARMKILFEKADYKGAKKSARAILSYDPGHAEALTTLTAAERKIREPIDRELKIGIQKYEADEYLEAIGHLAKVKQRDPGHHEAQFYLTYAIEALTHQAARQSAASRRGKSGMTGVSFDPAKSRRYYSDGLQSYAQGNLEEAAWYWKKSLHWDKQNKLAQRAYKRVLLALKTKRDSI